MKPRHADHMEPAGHFVENTGNTPLRFLEIFKSGESEYHILLHTQADLFEYSILDRFQDISLQQVCFLMFPSSNYTDLNNVHSG